MAERKMLREIMNLADIYMYADSISEMLRETYGGYDADVFDEVMVDEAFARRLAARGYDVRPWQPETAARPAGETVPVVVIRRPAASGVGRATPAQPRTPVTRSRSGLPLRPSSAAAPASQPPASEAAGDSWSREPGAPAAPPASAPVTPQTAGAAPSAANGTSAGQPAAQDGVAGAEATTTPESTTATRRTRTTRTTGSASSTTGTTRTRRTRTASGESSAAAEEEATGTTRTRRTRTRRTTQNDEEDV